MLSRNARRDFFESPGWLGLCLVWHGWPALNGGTPTWVRVGAGLLAVACLVPLVRALATRPSASTQPRQERPTPDPPA